MATNNSVLQPGRLDIRFANKVRETAAELHGCMEEAEPCRDERWHRSHKLTYVSSYAPHVVGLGRYACWRAAEIDAALRHSHDDEHLRGRCDGRHARSSSESRELSTGSR